jgi:hypothetical protein
MGILFSTGCGLTCQVMQSFHVCTVLEQPMLDQHSGVCYLAWRLGVPLPSILAWFALDAQWGNHEGLRHLYLWLLDWLSGGDYLPPAPIPRGNDPWVACSYSLASLFMAASSGSPVTFWFAFALRLLCIIRSAVAPHMHAMFQSGTLFSADLGFQSMIWGEEPRCGVPRGPVIPMLCLGFAMRKLGPPHHTLFIDKACCWRFGWHDLLTLLSTKFRRVELLLSFEFNLLKISSVKLVA